MTPPPLPHNQNISVSFTFPRGKGGIIIINTSDFEDFDDLRNYLQDSFMKMFKEWLSI